MSRAKAKMAATDPNALPVIRTPEQTGEQAKAPTAFAPFNQWCGSHQSVSRQPTG